MTITAPEPTPAAPAFPAPEHSTLCAAFQATAAAHGEHVALRTPGDGVRLTWSEYAERVRRDHALFVEAFRQGAVGVDAV